MKNPKISIITPSFNQGQFIEEAIDSVLSQKYSDLDYIIIDGGSSDNTVEIIKKHEKHISYWMSEPDKGQSHAINKGLKVVKGEVLNWLNSDDYYEPDAFRTVEHLFEAGITGIGGKSRLFNSRGTIKISKGTDVYPNNLAKTIGWARIDQPETFFSKEAWDKVGLLNENLHYCMDREWWIRYLYHFGLDGFNQSDNVLVNFRIHDESKTTTSQSGFLREHHSLFYAIGEAAEQKTACQMLANELDINTELPTAIRNWNNRSLADASFNYYLLKTADEFYANDQPALARTFLRYVNKGLLDREDVQLYKKLSWRSRVPQFIIKWLRSR